MNQRQITIAFLCFVSLMFIGCEPMTKNKTENDNHSHDHGDHTHSHADDDGNESEDGHSDSNSDHVHGINGGHVFKFEPADFAGEWVQSRKSDWVHVYILDTNRKKSHPVAADSIIIKRGESIFSLDPEYDKDEESASKFSLEDQKLAIAMNLGVTVELTVGETKYVGQIEPLKHHAH